MSIVKDSIEELEEFMHSGKTENVSIEKLLDKFIVVDKNLILKTDIENAKGFTALQVIKMELKRKNLKKSAKTIHEFCEWYIKVRISHGRLSRKEILDAISAIKRENSTSTIGARLLNIGEDKNGNKQ